MNLEMDQSIVEAYIDLRNACLDEMSNPEVRATPQMAVTIIREYNRKWNKMRETKPDLAEDGFIKLMKKQLEQFDFPQPYKDAFRYL